MADSQFRFDYFADNLGMWVLLGVREIQTVARQFAHLARRIARALVSLPAMGETVVCIAHQGTISMPSRFGHDFRGIVYTPLPFEPASAN